MGSRRNASEDEIEKLYTEGVSISVLLTPFG
jgi:hypothetical protein